MSFTTLQTALWVVGFVGHLLLLTVLVVRGRVRSFPVFSALIAYQLAETVALVLIARTGSGHAYLVGYWSFAPLDYGFQIALIYEIARTVLRTAGTWLYEVRVRVAVGSVLALVSAVVLCAMISPPTLGRLSLWEMRVTLFTSLLTCELFLCVSLAANRLGLAWGSHVMALGQGLAAWAIIAIIGDVARVATGWRQEFLFFDELRMYVYLAVLLFWAIAFWRPERKRPELSPEDEDQLLSLHQQVRTDLETLNKRDGRSVSP